jgi:type II secretory pathway component PulM
MQCAWYVNVILYLIVMDPCLTQQTADKAANEKTKQILAYINELPKQSI